MAVTRAAEEPVTQWAIDLLAGMDSNFEVGDHRAPDGADPSVAPYLIVYVVSPLRSGPPLAAPDADLQLTIQVTAVGWTRAQAMSLSDRAEARLVGRSPSGAYLAAGGSIPGMTVHDRISSGSPGGVDVSGTPPDEVYTVPRRYDLTATPTGA
jgi:hypothetical protein